MLHKKEYWLYSQSRNQVGLVGLNSSLTHTVVLASNHNAVEKLEFGSSDIEWLKKFYIIWFKISSYLFNLLIKDLSQLWDVDGTF